MQPRLLKHPARLAGASLLRLQDDERLVALAREGHDPAFAAIVDRYRGPLERYCARLLGPGRAEDAVQQAFVNAHAAMRASDQELALKPWLYRIAHNASLNILRGDAGDRDALDEDRPGVTETADVVEVRERLRGALAAIQALPAAQRDALLLRELEGRSHEEIAVALGVSPGGARQHLHRARLALRTTASAITPYPLLARVLSAAAAEGGRSSDLVVGAGVGAGAGVAKAATALLATGAIVGGALNATHHAPVRAADHPDSSRPVRAGGAAGARGASGPATAVAETVHRGRGRDHAEDGPHGGRGRDGDDRSGHRDGTSGEDSPSGRHGSGDGGSDDHGGTTGGSGTSGSGSGSGSSGPGSGDSGSGDTLADDDGGTSGTSGSGSGTSGSGDDTPGGTDGGLLDDHSGTSGSGTSGSGTSGSGELTSGGSGTSGSGELTSGSGGGGSDDS